MEGSEPCRVLDAVSVPLGAELPHGDAAMLVDGEEVCALVLACQELVRLLGFEEVKALDRHTVDALDVDDESPEACLQLSRREVGLSVVCVGGLVGRLLEPLADLVE